MISVALIGLGQKPTHQINCKRHERRRLLAHEFAIHGRRTHGFPIENAHVPAELAAFPQRMQLMPDKFAKRVLAGHTLHLLCMGELLLGEGAKSHPQDFAVEET